MVKLANILSKGGWAISVITFSPRENNTLQVLLDDSIDIHTFNGQSTRNPYLWWILRKRLLKINPHIVFGWSLYSNLAVSLVTQPDDEWKLILSERNYLPKVMSKSYFHRFILLAVKKMYLRADYITANSHVGLKWLRRYLGKGPKYIFLPNTVNVDDALKMSAEPIPEQYNKSKLHLLAVGRLHYQKGFDVLLNSLAIVKDRMSFEIIIVGAGGEELKLKEQAHNLGLDDCIQWVGAKVNPFPYYGWSDIVIVPSRYEGFPNVPLEAMACGRAVICSDCKTGPKELTNNGRYGKLVPVGDVQTLAKTINDLGNNTEELNLLGKSATKHIRETYQENNLIASIETMLTE